MLPSPRRPALSPGPPFARPPRPHIPRFKRGSSKAQLRIYHERQLVRKPDVGNSKVWMQLTCYI